MTITAGVDIGGTKIAAAAVDEQGRMLAKVRRPTPATDLAATVATIAEVLEDLRAGHDVRAVGIGAPGFVDSDRGVLRFAPNASWRDAPLADLVASATGLPVDLENDANAAAWGEFVSGAGADVDDQVLVTVGTGIGGGIVLGGRLLRGGFGIAGEIGHMRVVPGGRRCGCGQLGCWEAYASGNAMTRRAQEHAASGSGEGTLLREMAGGDPASITGQTVTAAALEGDPLAVELLGETGRWVGEGVASMAAVLDPAAVVIGGGVSDAGDLLLDPIRAAFHRHLSAGSHRPVAEIRRARLGNDAGIVGAADLARLRVAETSPLR